MKTHNKVSLLEFRRNLRKRSTPAEEEFWKYFRNGQIHGLKFKRQHSIGNYIVDFYCAAHRLVIELDGGIHNLKEQKEKDRNRDTHLTDMGFTIIRFKNKEVFRSIYEVTQKIINTIEQKK